jgi:hypothetical protein
MPWYRPRPSRPDLFPQSLETIRRLSDLLESHEVFGTTAFQIFPLHSTISGDNQGLVFNVPPPGVRKVSLVAGDFLSRAHHRIQIVIATNIAETGELSTRLSLAGLPLTPDDLRYHDPRRDLCHRFWKASRDAVSLLTPWGRAPRTYENI